VALGFRVKTGRAILVALAGTAANPLLLFRREVQLCDPRVPESRQPYHGSAMPFTPAPPQRIASGTQAAHRVGVAVVRALTQEMRASGMRVAGVTLIVASNPDITRIGSAHVRAHAQEGILFRKVLEASAHACRLPAQVLLERQALEHAAATLRRTPAQLQQSLAEFGRQAGRPWRTEEKSAALGAWLALKK